jgi:hypothetical protein
MMVLRESAVQGLRPVSPTQGLRHASPTLRQPCPLPTAQSGRYRPHWSRGGWYHPISTNCHWSRRPTTRCQLMIGPCFQFEFKIKYLN